MSNVMIDGDTGSVIPMSSQNSEYLAGINKNVQVDNSILARVLGKNNQVQKEFEKIENQISIITEITKGNTKIATIIAGQKQQLLLDISRITRNFSILMSDLERETFEIRAQKLSELAGTFEEILKNIENSSHSQKIKDKLIQSAENDFEKRYAAIGDNLFTIQPTRNSITALY